MKKLIDKTNTAPADATWLYGDMVDETGVDDGNRVDKEFMTDIVQLMERMMSVSGIAANGLPDNEVNGWQLYKAFKPYKVYSALITQAGTAHPTVIILRNEIGNIVWTRGAAGAYTGTLIGVFTYLKTTMTLNNDNFNATILPVIEKSIPANINTVGIATAANPPVGNVDDKLNKTFIEIRVYG